jgi:hypothetical protein
MDAMRLFHVEQVDSLLTSRDAKSCVSIEAFVPRGTNLINRPM